VKLESGFKGGIKSEEEVKERKISFRLPGGVAQPKQWVWFPVAGGAGCCAPIGTLRLSGIACYALYR